MSYVMVTPTDDAGGLSSLSVAAPPLPDPPSLRALAALSVALLVACTFIACGSEVALHAAVAGLGWAVVAGLLALVCRRWVAS